MEPLTDQPTIHISDPHKKPKISTNIYFKKVVYITVIFFFLIYTVSKTVFRFLYSFKLARLQTISCDLREIEYKFEDGIPTTEIPIKNFSWIVKNVKPKNLLFKINYQINTNDTSTLDFTFGGTNNNALLEPVSTRFFDNIIFYFIIPEEIVEESRRLCK